MSSPVLPAGSPAEIPTSVEPLDRDAPRSTRLLGTLVSAFICVMLLGQLLIGFTYHGGQSFPLLAYPMFSRAHFDGERLNNYLVYASADGGPEQPFDHERMELGDTLYQKLVAGAVIKGEKRDVIRDLAASVCRSQPAEVVTLNAYDSGYYITRSGPVGEGKRLVGSVAFACDDQ